MRVNTWKELSFDVEVEVSVDDLLTEMGSRADEDDGGGVYRRWEVIDGATRILERITPAFFDRLPPKQQLSVAARLRERLLPFVLWCENVLLDGLSEANSAKQQEPKE